jgi:diguanylate cyclase (GGDEF)-like protein
MLKQILVIDSDAKNRRLLIDTLSNTYELHVSETVEKAIGILSAKAASRISAIILNISASESESYAFLSALHGAPGLNGLPVLVLADSYDNAAETRGLELGAYDFVPMPFSPAILLFRLKNTIERSEYAAFGRYRYLAEYDAISGVYNRAKFYDITRRMLDSHPEFRYVLARFDLDRFKAYNDLFGVAAGDKLLLEIGKHFRRYFNPESTFGRLEADHFVFCLPVEDFDPSRCLLDFTNHFTEFQPNFVLSPRIGVYLIEDPSLEVSLMCDRALMALRSVKDGSPSASHIITTPCAN